MTPDEETKDRIQDIVKNYLDNPEVRWVQTEKEAKEILEDAENRFELLVTQPNIPTDRKSTRDERQLRGIELVRFAAESFDLASILLVDTVTGELNRTAKQFERCDLVEMSLSLEKDIATSLDRLLKGAGERTREQAKERRRAGGGGCVDVEITLTAGTEKGYYRIKEPGTPVRDGTLTIDEKTLQKLIGRSKRLRSQSDYEAWEGSLREIGEGLFRELYLNRKFMKNWYGALGRVGEDLTKARFRFKVQEETYPLALEAIVEEEEPKFWMLRAPVSRRLDQEAYRYPLFSPAAEEPETYRCLIVEADTWGLCRELGESFERLENLRVECDWLQEFITGGGERKPKRQWECKRIGGEEVREAGKSLRDLLERELCENPPWHLVHFAGHSYYQQEKKKGLLLLPSATDGEMETLTSERFATWLDEADTRFVYMSSCDSSSEEIVFELTRGLVPAIVGFRWDINDESAAEYAKIFYEDLLSNDRPSLEYSFFRARRRMYEIYHEQEDWIWAAPMLILQS